MPSLTVKHKPPYCDDLRHRNGTLGGWLLWFFSTVRCEGRKP